MNRSVLALGLVAAVSASAAAQQRPFQALREPDFCGDDPRYRCVGYEPGRPIRVVVPVGSHVTLQFLENSTVLEPIGARIETAGDIAATTAAGGEKKEDPKEWFVTYADNFLNIQPLNPSIPVSMMTVPVKMPNGKILPHVFELNTRRGAASLWRCVAPPAKEGDAPRDRDCMTKEEVRAANRDNMVQIDFSYPNAAQLRSDQDKQAARRAAEERAAAASAATARDALRQEAAYGANREWRFIARGDAEVTPRKVSENGNSMLLEFDANARLPSPYLLEVPQGQDGDCDGKNEARAQFDMQGPGLLQIHGVFKDICLRRGNQLVAQVRLTTPIRDNMNPMTGTISPRVVRAVRRPGRGDAS